MASTVKEAVYIHKKVIQGHHIYKAVWNPVLGKIHCLDPEEGNKHDRFAVCVERRWDYRSRS